MIKSVFVDSFKFLLQCVKQRGSGKIASLKVSSSPRVMTLACLHARMLLPKRRVLTSPFHQRAPAITKRGFHLLGLLLVNFLTELVSIAQDQQRLMIVPPACLEKKTVTLWISFAKKSSATLEPSSKQSTTLKFQGPKLFTFFNIVSPLYNQLKEFVIDQQHFLIGFTCSVC